MKKLIQLAAIDPNPHRDLTRYPPNPEQVKKLIESIGRTGFWNNLVVRPHPEQEGRYQLAYGHNRIEACRQAGVMEAELETIELGDYDMLCCMIDENLTQQHVGPKTIFEIVAAAIQEAEKMLRETKNVHEFNANFKHSRGLPSLLQESNRLDPDDAFSWEQEHYDRAKAAIEPSGQGLGKDFLRRFLPPHSVANNNTLQTAITAYYQERWREEGQNRLDDSQRTLWQAKETNDQKQMDAALELEKQARVLLGKVKAGGVSRALLEKLDSTSKMGDVVRLVKDNKIPEQYHEELIDLAANWSADSQTTHKAGTSISIRGGIWWENISGEYSERMRAIKESLKQQELTERLRSQPPHKVAVEIIADYSRALRKTKEADEYLELVAPYLDAVQGKELEKVQDTLTRLRDSLADKLNRIEALVWANQLRLSPREINPVRPTPLLIEGQAL